MKGLWRNVLLFSSIVLTLTLVDGQNKGFQLPTLNRDPPKPVVPADLANYFQLPDAGARKFVGSYLPGFIPPASFDVLDPFQQQQSLLQNQPLGVLTASNGFGSGLNPGSGSGLNLGSGSGLNPSSSPFNSLSLSQSSNNAFPFLPQIPSGFQPGINIRPSFRGDGNETDAKNNASSISGIPNVFPSLPKAPVPQSVQTFPTLPVRPEVPQGGLGPLANSLAASGNFPALAQGSSQFQAPSLNSLNILQRLAGQSTPVAPGSPFLPNSGLQGALPQSGVGGNAFPGGSAFPSASGLYPQQSPGNDNLIAQLLRTVGLGGIGNNLDLSAVNQILGLTPQQNPQGSGLLSNVIYNALTDNNIQSLDSTNGTNIIDSKANAALIQNLITQPSSPFCNPKPLPVDKFDVDAFTGKWYQVLYSPPLSAGPCSMITYQKLADVGQGGPGTVFDTFEYTTEATPYGKPRISSGYGIVRGPGQLIYRTTNSPTDVNVYVLQTGPMNTDGQYEYIVLAVNCNYPLHVFARDPVVYKQKYESEVNSLLEKRGLVTSWSRLLNMVAPVDYNLCTFPPSLFNVRG